MASKYTVSTYNPKDVSLVIAGYQVTGWESISIARSVDGFTQIRGIRGKNTRVNNLDSSATIILPLLQTSPANDTLSAIHELDLQNGTGRIALTLKDNSGRSIFSSNEAYIVAFPEVIFSGEFTYRPWRIFCQTTDSYSLAGNTKPVTTIYNGALSEVASFLSGLF